MNTVPEAFIHQSRGFLMNNFLPKIERCVEKLSDDDIWWRPNEDSNSIGNLILHLSGNVRQWVLTGLGGAPDTRIRQQEFDDRRVRSGKELAEQLRHTVEQADAVLAALPSESLLDQHTVQGRSVNVLFVIYHVVEHFSMHTGQIIQITKTRTGDLKFYDQSGGISRPQWNRETGGNR